MPESPGLEPLIPMLDSVASNVLVSAALFTALIQLLAAKELVSDEEVREMYETALRMLEEQQGSDAHTDAIYEDAREIIEAQLR